MISDFNIGIRYQLYNLSYEIAIVLDTKTGMMKEGMVAWLVIIKEVLNAMRFAPLSSLFKL
uniref:Uncharacterized protein n=1 Tax=Virgibacillus oceani TaxID=1479511 RepID=A0A917HDW3_9BACI|nr:hypothetical protein GCM10011398_20940 [Virgibacillus oceani]